MLHERENVQKSERLISTKDHEFFSPSLFLADSLSEYPKPKQVERDHPQRVESEELNLHLEMPLSSQQWMDLSTSLGPVFRCLRSILKLHPAANYKSLISP